MATHIFASPPARFTVDVPQSEVADLHSRLDKTRWPATEIVPEGGSDGSTAFGLGAGPTLPLMKELAKGWRVFDWKQAQDRLNTFEHFTVEIEDLSIHFLHHRSTRPNAVPLILCHGWPGHFGEFLHAIPLLTEPADPAAQAFHVVAPSMPGYAWSSPPPSAKWQMPDTARVFDKLMTGLGYEKYMAQGGDWGSITARCLGSLHKNHCKAVHLNFLPVFPPIPMWLISPHTLLAWAPRFLVSEKQAARMKRGLAYLEKGSAYYVMQQLTPRTPAYGLTDSPVGLLAWLGEKFEPTIREASTQAKPTLTREELYFTCSLYWFTRSIGTSFLPYSLNPHFSTFLTDSKYSLPNFALSLFPGELYSPPERDARRTGNLKWIKESPEGGHFAALEKPDVFVEHLREATGVLWEE